MTSGSDEDLEQAMKEASSDPAASEQALAQLERALRKVEREAKDIERELESRGTPFASATPTGQT